MIGMLYGMQLNLETRNKMAVSYFGKVRNLEYWMEEEFYEDSGR